MLRRTTAAPARPDYQAVVGSTLLHIAADPLTPTTGLVDPAGLQYVQGRQCGARGLSRAIYDFVGLAADEQLPAPVQAALRAPAVFRAAATSGIHRLRLCPISSGIHAGPMEGRMMQLTAAALHTSQKRGRPQQPSDARHAQPRPSPGTCAAEAALPAGTVASSRNIDDGAAYRSAFGCVKLGGTL